MVEDGSPHVEFETPLAIDSLSEGVTPEFKDVSGKLFAKSGETSEYSSGTRAFPTPLSVMCNLEHVSNDYSAEEEAFNRHYLPLRLVDFPGDALHERYRTSILEEFLHHEDRVLPISIIIPAKASWTERLLLIETLGSIRRQTLVQKLPQKVEVFIVQDGVAASDEDNPISEELFVELNRFPKRTRFRLFRLEGQPPRRGTARNVGLVKANSAHPGTIVFFLDCSMVLNKNFLAEHMIRHGARKRLALLGFKQNIRLCEYPKVREAMIHNDRWPDFKKDWKWEHTVAEEPIDLNDRRVAIGENVCYMELTSDFRCLMGTTKVGRRIGTPAFFHTGLTSVPLNAILSAGGFDPDFDACWGLEDTCLGAFLVCDGIKIVPCPSSVAFQIRDPEETTGKEPDRAVNLRMYDKKICEGRAGAGHWERLKQGVDALESSKQLAPVDWPYTLKPSRTGGLQTVTKRK
jgi:hypothetical protein